MIIDMPFMYRVEGLKVRAKRPDVMFALSSMPVRIEEYGTNDIEIIGQLNKRVYGSETPNKTEYGIL
jgi:hypothetical protein